MTTTTSIASPWTRRRLLGLGIAATTALIGGCSSSENSDGAPAAGDNGDGWAGTLLDPPFEKPDVTLTDLDGRPFPFRTATDGNLTILFFGFTSCPDICPIFLNSITIGRELIGAGPGSEPQVLFVGRPAGAIARRTSVIVQPREGAAHASHRRRQDQDHHRRRGRHGVDPEQG